MKTDENFERGIFGDLAKIHGECAGQSDLVRLEYSYYCLNDLKGEEFVEELEKMKYESEIDATGRKCDCARVYGTTNWLKNDQETIKRWYTEMKNVGWYYECDFSYYSINEERVMKMDEILNSKQVVNEEQFENRKEMHETTSAAVMEIMRNLGDADTEELVLEFFFYTDEKSKAEDLGQVLKKYGYVVHIAEIAKGKLKYSITGQTIPLPNEDDVVINWSKRMNELGFIHDCEFDGWGTPVMKGGWFSDDTPAEEVQRRLGLPPLE